MSGVGKSNKSSGYSFIFVRNEHTSWISAQHYELWLSSPTFLHLQSFGDYLRNLLSDIVVACEI